MTPSGRADPVIEIRGLSKRFGDRAALRDIDLEVGPGESLALFGPNGSGKTTLVRILTSTLKSSGGTFRIAGLDPRRADRETRAMVGALFHQTFLYDELSALDNLVFFGRMYGVAGVRDRALSLLESLGLGDRAEDAVGGFSRGMQQRLALARCLVHDPRIVFLDEPFTGLDPHSAATFMQALRRLRDQGRTLLLVTHNLARGLELCDRWVILGRGRIVDQGRSDGLDRVQFERTYLERLGQARAASRIP